MLCCTNFLDFHSAQRHNSRPKMLQQSQYNSGQQTNTISSGALYVMNCARRQNMKLEIFLCEQASLGLGINWTVMSTFAMFSELSSHLVTVRKLSHCQSWSCTDEMSNGFRRSREGQNCGKFGGQAETNLPFTINPLLFWIHTLLPLCRFQLWNLKTIHTHYTMPIYWAKFLKKI